MILKAAHSIEFTKTLFQYKARRLTSFWFTGIPAAVVSRFFSFTSYRFESLIRLWYCPHIIRVEYYIFLVKSYGYMEFIIFQRYPKLYIPGRSDFFLKWWELWKLHYHPSPLRVRTYIICTACTKENSEHRGAHRRRLTIIYRQRNSKEVPLLYVSSRASRVWVLKMRLSIYYICTYLNFFFFIRR
jgi:hypothetical protein